MRKKNIFGLFLFSVFCWDMKNVIKISHALDIYSYIVLVVIYEFYGDMTVK